MPTTLAEALTDDRVDFQELHRRYRPVLSMVDVLIGVVPNCDPYLEIWAPGFRTYNLMVPNFLNLPAALLGRGAPKDVVGLGMYAASRAANCAYCSAHTCSFALRRGSSAHAVLGRSRTPQEAAAVTVAEALSTMPHHYEPNLGALLSNHYSDDDAEWIIMAVAMMGFLNKFMDALGVELEQESVDDVAGLIEPTGWSVGRHGWNGARSDAAGGGTSAVPTDSLGTFLRVFRNAPGAVRLEREWMRGVPKDPAEAHRLVAERFGYDEALLTMMRHSKPRRALAAMLRQNLDPKQSRLGIGTKALAALVFATHAANPYLAERSLKLASNNGVASAAIQAAASRSIELTTGADFGVDDTTMATIALARAISPSPAAVDEETIALATSSLSSAQIVELVVWVSVNQLLHRLSLYFGLADIESHTGPRSAVS